MIPIQRFRVLYRFIWAGLSINVATGLILFVTQAADRVVDPVFGLKLASIALAFWCGVAARRLVLGAPGATTTRARAVAAGGLALWTVAIVSGRLMAYFAT
jgi:hypothetical protein